MQISTSAWPQLLNDILAFKLDGAVIAIKNQHPDIDYVEIYNEKLVLITSPLLGEINTPQDLKGKDILMWPEGCPYRTSLTDWLNKYGIAPGIISIASYGTILGCVSSGAGVSLVPKGVFDQFRAMGNINGYAFEDLLPIQNYFVWHKKIGAHRARDAFADLLKDEFEEV